MREMIAHGVAGRPGLARRNGVPHRAMLVERGAPRAGVFEVVCKLREIRIEALVEQLADHAHQHGIAEASGDRNMERAIMHHRGFAGMLDIFHGDEGGIDARNVVLRRHARGLLGNRALDEFAGAQQLERTFDDGRCRHQHSARALDHIDAGTDADADASLDFERDQGFAYRRPRDLELLGELALGRQAAADRVLAAVDQASQLIGDLAIEPSRLHSFQRHAGLPARAAPGWSQRPANLENWPYQLTRALTEDRRHVKQRPNKGRDDHAH